MDDTPKKHHPGSENLRVWPKGQCGNPGGTTKAVRHVRDMLRKLHPDCEKALRGLIAQWEQHPFAALQAIQIVYARSIGKERDADALWSKTKTEAVGPDFSGLSPDQLDRIDAIVKEGMS